MACFRFGNISFWISPVSIMKCFIGIGWVARGSEEELEEYSIFFNNFSHFLMEQDNEMEIHQFCEIITDKIDEITQNYNLKSELIKKFSDIIKNTLKNPVNQTRAIQYANEYSKWVLGWINSYFGEIAQLAVSKFNDWKVEPLKDALGAVGSFGNAVYGKYVPSLEAVCIQMDTVSESECPEIQFIETLLHEEVHFVIHHHMGEDDERPELTWLDELAAVLTSQYAIESVAIELKSNNKIQQIIECLKKIRNKQKYGELAEAVLKDTEDALLPWKAWKEIFRLPEDQKRDYAKEKIIKPILHNLGWKVEFPYEYGNKYVTVFI